MKVVYFAWLRDQLGADENFDNLPQNVATVADLLDFLRARDDLHKRALSDVSKIRVAINRQFAEPDSKVSLDDEVAFFPPITGG